jgi:hypothetical protein
LLGSSPEIYPDIRKNIAFLGISLEISLLNTLAGENRTSRRTPPVLLPLRPPHYLTHTVSDQGRARGKLPATDTEWGL